MKYHNLFCGKIRKISLICRLLNLHREWQRLIRDNDNITADTTVNYIICPKFLTLFHIIICRILLFMQ